MAKPNSATFPLSTQSGFSLVTSKQPEMKETTPLTKDGLDNMRKELHKLSGDYRNMENKINAQEKRISELTVLINQLSKTVNTLSQKNGISARQILSQQTYAKPVTEMNVPADSGPVTAKFVTKEQIAPLTTQIKGYKVYDNPELLEILVPASRQGLIHSSIDNEQLPEYKEGYSLIVAELANGTYIVTYGFYNSNTKQISI